MKIVVDSTYCVISIECEDEITDTKVTINVRNEMSLTNDERQRHGLFPYIDYTKNLKEKKRWKKNY